MKVVVYLLKFLVNILNRVTLLMRSVLNESNFILKVSLSVILCRYLSAWPYIMQ